MTYTEAKYRVMSPEYHSWLKNYIDEHGLADSRATKENDESGIFLNILPHFHAWLQEYGAISYSDLCIEENTACTTNFFIINNEYYRISSAFGLHDFCYCEKLNKAPKGRNIFVVK